MRLIDADEAYKVLTEYYHHKEQIQHDALKEAIDRVPTITPLHSRDWNGWETGCGRTYDVQPKKGKWIYHEPLDVFECSVCGRQMVRNIFNYCPWCGAKMEEEK